MKRRWSWIVVTGVLLGAAWQVSAQQPGGPPAPGRPQPGGSALILGRVVDAATNQPIAMATVSLGGGAPPSAQTGLPSAQPSSMSNADGYFLFRDLRKASGYMLTAQANGYLPGI